jgi:TorA maturation chaperone TorD
MGEGMIADISEYEGGSVTELQDPDPSATEISAEDRGRADIYRLLALLLGNPPGQDILDLLKAVQPDDTELGKILASLGDIATSAGRENIAEEFSDLFVGAPMARFMPYASHYSDGHLFGRALAELRMDLGKLGIARRDDATEPEDHIATLFEIMSGLLLGSFHSAPVPLKDQARFLSRHITPWAPAFFYELEAAKGTQFYGVVARLGRTFVELETEAFRMI